MALRGVVPKTQLAGFVPELIKHSEPLIQHDALPLIDYCYEVRVTCDGSNPYYERKGRSIFMVTQLIAPEITTGFETGDAYLPVLLLAREEELASIIVAESKQCVMITFTITHTKTETRRTPSWIVRRSDANVVH